MKNSFLEKSVDIVSPCRISAPGMLVFWFIKKGQTLSSLKAATVLVLLHFVCSLLTIMLDILQNSVSILFVPYKLQLGLEASGSTGEQMSPYSCPRGQEFLTQLLEEVQSYAFPPGIYCSFEQFLVLKQDFSHKQYSLFIQLTFQCYQVCGEQNQNVNPRSSLSIKDKGFCQLFTHTLHKKRKNFKNSST